MLDTAYHYLDLVPKGRDEDGLPHTQAWSGTMISTRAPVAEAGLDGQARPARLGRAGGALSSLGALLVALLVPKCPLCVAAWLGAAGLGAGAATLVAPFVRPAALLLAAAALLFLAWSVRRAVAARGGAAHRSTDCGCP